jgi:transcriptional regulator with XRE-family HTH domain
MSPKNREVQAVIEENKVVFSSLRRSDIAHQFKAKMIQKGLKNVDVAERLGVSEANVSRWFSGSQNLSLDTLYAIADALQERLSVMLESKEQFCELLNLDEADFGPNWELPKDDSEFRQHTPDMSLYALTDAYPAANDGGFLIEEHARERFA